VPFADNLTALAANYLAVLYVWQRAAERPLLQILRYVQKVGRWGNGGPCPSSAVTACSRLRWRALMAVCGRGSWPRVAALGFEVVPTPSRSRLCDGSKRTAMFQPLPCVERAAAPRPS